jgi:membrane-associated protein
MNSLISWVFNDHGVEQLLEHHLLTGWLMIGAVVYLETALIFMVFLPVDSLLIAAGAFLGAQHASMALPVAVLSIAALMGDTTAFALAHSHFGNALIKEKWVSRRKIEQTRLFFRKYGPAAIIVCRFIGFVRSVSPLAAGVSRIGVTRYLTSDAVGCVAWTATILTLGYRLGKISWVQLHLTVLSVALVLVALLVVAVQGLMLYVSKRR